MENPSWDRWHGLDDEEAGRVRMPTHQVAHATGATVLAAETIPDVTAPELVIND
ncbi:MAG TPA: hypothetical protein VLG92_04940 [Candidatus Saccharimonadia bacterium]|nr:hypothetical protein [Candidatus Saccharimonadia bacterium]